MGVTGIDTGNLGGLFERAPFEQDGWDGALKALASATGSTRAQLIALGAHQELFNWVTDAPVEFLADFAETCGYTPRGNYRVAATRAPMELTWEHHYDEARRVHEDEAYVTYMREFGGEHGAQIVLEEREETFFGLAILRGDAEGRTCERDRAVLKQAAPHVLSAVKVQNAIEHQGVQLLQGSLDTLRTAAVLLDAYGRVSIVTDAAAALLGPETIQIRDRILTCPRPDFDKRLKRAMATAISSNTALPSELWISTTLGPMLVEVCRLPRQEWGFAFAPRAIVTLKAPLPRSDDQAPRLAEAFELTRAEAEIVALLAQGHSRSQIALIRNVSAQTVTTQLRTIFHKVGVNREAELVVRARAIVEMASR